MHSIHFSVSNLWKFHAETCNPAIIFNSPFDLSVESWLDHSQFSLSSAMGWSLLKWAEESKQRQQSHLDPMWLPFARSFLQSPFPQWCNAVTLSVFPVSCVPIFWFYLLMKSFHFLLYYIYLHLAILIFTNRCKNSRRKRLLSSTCYFWSLECCPGNIRCSANVCERFYNCFFSS